jgi:hypothetical protein
LAVASLLVVPLKKAFAPEVWTANIVANTRAGQRSKRIELGWETDFPVVGCEPTRLMIRYNKQVRGTASSPSPLNPSDGTFLTYKSITNNSYDHVLLHADTSYAYTIYACTSATACMAVCSNVVATVDEVSTQRERWVLQGIHGYDQDTGSRILSPSSWPEQHSPELHRYGAGTSYNGKMAVYFLGETDEDSPPYPVQVTHSSSASWEDNWNDPSEWSTPVMLASGTAGGDRNVLTSPQIVPTVDGEDNPRMRLFWVATDNTNDPSSFKLESALSTDADGDDFGLCCSDTAECSSTDGCSFGGSTVCCDFDDASAEVREEFDVEDGACLDDLGWHGHDLWDNQGPRWDEAENELVLLFTGQPDTGGTCGYCFNHGNPPGDIDLWFWDTGGGCDIADTALGPKFCLNTEFEDEDTGETGAAWCPKETFVDAHDPFGLPYPDEIKIYFKEGQNRWLVGYSSDNGRTIEDTSAVDFYFADEDSGDTAVDTDDVMSGGCAEDPTIIAWKNGSFTREVMVFLPQTPDDASHDRCFSTQDTAVPFDDIERFEGLIVAVLGNG